MKGVDQGLHPAALCARTVTVQFGIESTLKYAVRVVPETVCVDVPAPSLPLMTISYSSTGLFPGRAAFQVAMIVSVVPLGSATCHCAVSPVGGLWSDRGCRGREDDRARYRAGSTGWSCYHLIEARVGSRLPTRVVGLRMMCFVLANESFACVTCRLPPVRPTVSSAVRPAAADIRWLAQNRASHVAASASQVPLPLKQPTVAATLEQR